MIRRPERAMLPVAVLSAVLVATLTACERPQSQTEATVAADAATTESSTTAPASAWTELELGGCECSDGSPVTFLEHRGDPSKVVLYFEGGGACWSAETCNTDSADEKSYIATSTITGTDLDERSGYFDLDNPDNPLRDYSWLYVPYCTADMHLGTRRTEYGDGVEIEHRGFTNGLNALVHLAGGYPDAEQLVVTGTSAGSVPTPLFAGLASDLIPGADIVTFGDSSGAYPNSAPVATWLSGVWGTQGSIPDWPETEGLTGPDWSIPELYVYAGLHAPDIRFGRFDYAFDTVQASYDDLGAGDDLLLGLIERTEDEIEAAGVDIASYVAPGPIHTVIAGDAFYTTEVNGVRLVDWLDDLLNAPDPPPDVRCEVCT